MERDADRVLQLFIAAVNEAGGMTRMMTNRRLDWLPSLMESACTLLLQEEEHRQPEEIADLLGLTREAVENILTGPADSPGPLQGAPPDDELARGHMAGGVVRFAWAHHPPAS